MVMLACTARFHDPLLPCNRFREKRRKRVKICVLAVVILSFCRMVTAADNWKPAKAPLMTRWAKDVSPANVHPEYPRPQMVRKEWKNLNGLWQFASADEVKETPIGKDLSGQILVPFCME